MIFVEPPADNEIPIQENKKDDNEKPRPAPMLPQELPSAFVTGNNYALNSESILISSEEGIALNNLLIEQINEWKTDAEHNDNFWSRTDQMIMGNFGVVNALQNPLTENKFFINGQLHSENVKSNLEYFVYERGYDITDLENVPNNLVTPQKYDLSRAISKQWTNPLSNNLDIQHVKDLRDVSPNAFDITSEQEMQIFRESVKNNSFAVVSSLMPKLTVDESMFLPESDAQNNLEPASENKQIQSSGSEIANSELEQKHQRDNNKEQEQEIFQQTSHIKDSINDSDFTPNYSSQDNQQFPLFEIITSLLISITSIIVWVISKKYYINPQTSVTPLTVNTNYNYLNEVELLLKEATSLNKNQQFKDAYEKLSQSIRIFYSHKLKLEKEVTPSDIIPLMQNFHESEKILVKNSLRLSEMIEFAKHSEDSKRFEQILNEFYGIVSKEKI